MLKDARAFLICLLACFLLLAPSSFGQSQEKPRRKRVGLALSGGSALGLAHIGVLKWFEEHRIPVDCLAGTSMGGLVGGLYASGFSAAEIDAFVRNLSWQEVFQTAPAYGDLSFRRKEDMREYTNRFELGLRHGFRVPLGLSAGHGVGLALSRFTAPYSNLRHFDELPTPFRTVATDLVTGKQVVFENGDLFDALRSTMSLPGLFAPVRLGDKVLVDGGTLNNIPVELTQQMGAELLIAVALQDTEEKRYEPTSPFSVAGRTVDVMIVANENRSLRLANLVLSPDLKGLLPTDFLKMEEFEKRGYAAAERQAQFLKTLSVSEEEWQTYVAERRARRRPAQITPDFVEVRGTTSTEQAKLEQLLVRLKGEPVQTEALESSLTRITGHGRYEAADYHFGKSGGRDGLVVKVREKRHGPPLLNTALDIDGTDINDVRFGIGGRITFMDLGGPWSEWRTDVNLGYTNRIASEFYWRVKGSPVFLAPRGFVDYSRLPLYEGRNRVADYRSEQLGAGLDLGVAVNRFNEVRVGFETIHWSAFVSTGARILPSIEGNFHAFRAQWIYDGLDAPQIPRRGARLVTTIRYFFDTPFGSIQYPVFESRISFAHLFGRQHLMLTSLSGGTTAGRVASVPPFALGGPLRLSALARDQVRGENYYYGGLFYLRSLTNEQFTLFGRMYFSFGYEIGQAFDRTNRANPYNDGLAGLIGETPLGAIFIGGSIGEQGERKFFFRIGKLW